MNPTDREPTDVFTSMLHAIDTLDWDTFRSTFAAEIALDYTSLWGGEPEKTTVEDLVARWQPFASGFDATQHLTGPIVVAWSDAHSATCTTTVRAYHHVVADDGGSGTWMVSGQYRIGLELGTDGWKISAITLTLAYEEGDRGLVDVAQHRADTGTGGRTGHR
jgi:SnoaL-like domain